MRGHLHMQNLGLRIFIKMNNKFKQAWEELLRTEGEIRKKRQAAIYAQKERQRQIVEWTAVIIGVGVMGSFIFWLVIMALRAQGIIH